jgi:hypothetical protein
VNSEWSDGPRSAQNIFDFFFELRVIISLSLQTVRATGGRARSVAMHIDFVDGSIVAEIGCNGRTGRYEPYLDSVWPSDVESGGLQCPLMALADPEKVRIRRVQAGHARLPKSGRSERPRRVEAV